MYGHPIARELEAWWRIHGARHDDPDWQAYLADLETLFPVKLAELGAEHVNGDENGKRFGMSKAAGCTRAAALKYLGHEAEPFSGSTLVTFHIGHLLECMAIASLRACGYQVDGAQSAVTIDPTTTRPLSPATTVAQFQDHAASDRPARRRPAFPHPAPCRAGLARRNVLVAAKPG